MNKFYAERMVVLTEDNQAFIDSLLDTIFGTVLSDKIRKEALILAHSVFSQHQKIMEQAFPGRVLAISESQITDHFQKSIHKILQEDPEAVIIIADRYIARGIEKEYQNSVFRLSLTYRFGETTPRPGDPSFDEQLNSIENSLRSSRGKGLEGTTVVIADDTIVSGRTEIKLEELFRSRGAIVDREKSIYAYVAFNGAYEPDRDRENAAGVVVNRIASTEQRELGPLGGAIYQLEKNFALQEPAQAPFGDGKKTKINGLIHRNQLDMQQLTVFLELFEKLERLLKGIERLDGTPFTFFTLADFRWMLPSGVQFGLKDFYSEFSLSDTTQLIEKLSSLSMVEYIAFARHKIQNQQLPEISCVVEDVDGTCLKLRYSDSERKTFSATFLAQQVRERLFEYVLEFTKDHQRALQLHSKFLKYNSLQTVKMFPDFAQYLADNYTVHTKEKLHERFKAFYGDSSGEKELSIYLKKYSYLPFAYHVIREMTWGKIDIAKTHVFDADKAYEFNKKISQTGTSISFITAAPRIHAMEILIQTGQADLVVSQAARLITVEDLYDLVSFEEQNKSVFYKQLIEQGVSSNTMLVIGDQPHSDTKPAIALGAYGYVVDGPDDLENLFHYARFSGFLP